MSEELAMNALDEALNLARKLYRALKDYPVESEQRGKLLDEAKLLFGDDKEEEHAETA